MMRKHILSSAETLISGDRYDDYGDAQECFQNIADIWTVIKGVEFTAGDVGRFMMAVKLARTARNPGHKDGYIDLAGYAALTGEIEVKDVEI